MEPDQHLLLPPPGGRRHPRAGDRVRDVQRDRGAGCGAGEDGDGHPAQGAGAEGGSHGDPDRIAQVFGRISFFVNAGVRFVEEHAKLRAMGILWEELGRERYGVSDPRLLRLRYGVQVNSLGLTEAQPENNVQRIVLEALAVTIGRDARARAIQLPAWNEALGLPRPWDQQWSLRIQQVLAYETDILEYPDIFEGSKVMEGLVEELLEGARAEMAVVAEHGGAVEAVPYMKAALVDSHRERLRRIETLEQTVVGQNRFTGSEESPLTADAEGGILVVDQAVEAEQIAAVRRWRSLRDQAKVNAALAELARAAADPDESLMEPTIAAARAGATTGEWSRTLREVFGSYRAPTGVGEASGIPVEEDAGGLAPTPAAPRAATVPAPSTRTARAPTAVRQRASWHGCASGSPRSPSSSAAARRSSSASPASTGTPTAPSRSRCARATPAWTWCTRESASPPRRSPPRRCRRACT